MHQFFRYATHIHTRSSKTYKSIAPDKIAYVNLLPNYAPLSACQTENYEEYVEKFAEYIDEDYISVDIYPLSIDDKGVKHTSGVSSAIWIRLPPSAGKPTRISGVLSSP